MAKRLYTIIGLILFAVLLFLLMGSNQTGSKSLIWSVTLLYAGLVGCIHGFLSHTLNSRQKGNQIFYPVFMGMLFGVLAYIYLFLVLPRVIPGFFESAG